MLYFHNAIPAPPVVQLFHKCLLGAVHQTSYLWRDFLWRRITPAKIDRTVIGPLLRGAHLLRGGAVVSDHLGKGEQHGHAASIGPDNVACQVPEPHLQGNFFLFKVLGF
jgi:hypothetical protein